MNYNEQLNTFVEWAIEVRQWNEKTQIGEIYKFYKETKDRFPFINLLHDSETEFVIRVSKVVVEEARRAGRMNLPTLFYIRLKEKEEKRDHIKKIFDGLDDFKDHKMKLILMEELSELNRELKIMNEKVKTRVRTQDTL